MIEIQRKGQKMRFMTVAFVAIMSVMATLVQAAGLRLFEVPADGKGAALQAIMWSPCAARAGEINIGPFDIVPGVRDCPIAGENLPLVVISHGFGGTYLGHHDTAETLADAGFIVVALNHPGDTATNKEKAHDLSALITRPSDIKRLIDFMLGPSPDTTKIDPQRIGFYGFSRGGYTGLVLGGATPDFGQLRAHCSDAARLACAYERSKSMLETELVAEPRIKAIVIADPLSNVFPTIDTVKGVSVPVQLWSSQYGGDGVSPEEVAMVARNLTAKPEFHVVPNSGHFAFLTPCPAKLAKALPELCIDSPDFDRVAFHKEMNQQVLVFFRQHLIPGAPNSHLTHWPHASSTIPS